MYIPNVCAPPKKCPLLRIPGLNRISSYNTLVSLLMQPHGRYPPALLPHTLSIPPTNTLPHASLTALPPVIVSPPPKNRPTKSPSELKSVNLLRIVIFLALLKMKYRRRPSKVGNAVLRLLPCFRHYGGLSILIKSHYPNEKKFSNAVWLSACCDTCFVHAI